jgi:hypothetical protein
MLLSSDVVPWILIITYIVCPTKEWAVARIQSFLEPVYRKRGVRSPACLTLGRTVSWNPAEMGKT